MRDVGRLLAVRRRHVLASPAGRRICGIAQSRTCSAHLHARHLGYVIAVERVGIGVALPESPLDFAGSCADSLFGALDSRLERRRRGARVERSAAAFRQSDDGRHYDAKRHGGPAVRRVNLAHGFAAIRRSSAHSATRGEHGTGIALTGQDLGLRGSGSSPRIPRRLRRREEELERAHRRRGDARPRHGDPAHGCAGGEARRARRCRPLLRLERQGHRRCQRLARRHEEAHRRSRDGPSAGSRSGTSPPASRASTAASSPR
jgi:hypothetical protein